MLVSNFNFGLHDQFSSQKLKYYPSQRNSFNCTCTYFHLGPIWAYIGLQMHPSGDTCGSCGPICVWAHMDPIDRMHKFMVECTNYVD